MADEEVVVEKKEPEITVEIAPDNEKPGKPELTDEEVGKLDQLPADDEISRYAKDAQKRIKSLHIANQEWRRRVVQSSKDVATATTLAEQLYRENQQLKHNVDRSEVALIDQALQRTESQLAQARQRAKAAYTSQNTDEIVAANEDVARFVAESDRLRLLKPPAAPRRDPDAPPPAVSPARAPDQQPSPVSPGTQSWLNKNTWFGKAGEEEITGFAMGIHQSLDKQGITEVNNPAAYWGAIDRRLREVYPQRFTETKPESGSRPVTVTGAVRVNGAVESGKRSSRHIVLTESQVRLARSLDLTPEQYAAQLVKDEAAKERVQ